MGTGDARIFSEAVKAAQQRYGSRALYEKLSQRRGFRRDIDDVLSNLVATMRHFYLGTASADGQPYVQHRGGPPGFLKVLDARRLAFADYPGNRQYITVGNLSENPHAFIFLMDYPRQRRVKLWGHARVIERDPALLEMVSDHDAPTPERVIEFTVDAWDINCRKHITPRYSVDELPIVAQRALNGEEEGAET